MKSLKFLRLLFGIESKFILKIVPAWFSSDYVMFKYSNNGGITWKYIRCAHEPLLSEENWTIGRLTHSLGNGDFQGEKERFSSIEKIRGYEKYQYAFAKAKQEELDKHRKEIREGKTRAYKRANS